MKPVVSFYSKDKFIYSVDYTVLLCADDQPTIQFLQQIENQLSSKMKILQVNFDAFSKNSEDHRAALYPSAKAAVFVLESYELLTIDQIILKNPISLASEANFVLCSTKSKFTENVLNIKRMIAAGRFYQVNLTCAFKAEMIEDSLNFFLRRYESYNGHYKAYLPFENHSIISFSPELFIEKSGTTLVTRPIKGSIGRSGHFENELIRSEKEQAELSMIVDLLRNDLNSLELKNSATVTKHREVMNLNYIKHTYSEIQIQTDKTLSTVLEKMIPGGSISGCPKQESLLAISELEPTQRSAYTGAIGWWHQNEFSLNIAIRTFVQTDANYYYFAGCGIVFDSDPEKEFSELINKTGQLQVIYE